jgi:putative membrane protein
MPLHSAAFAFLHHVAAFTLFAAILVEFVLINAELTAANARRLARTDIMLGISAGVVLVIGALRVFYFEKGADYYFDSAFFLAKLGLFIAVGLLSIIPTLAFISWRTAVKQGQAPTVTPSQLRTLKMVIHIELAAVVLIMLFAALMARGLEL